MWTPRQLTIKNQDMSKVPSDIEIAQAANKLPINDVAAKIGLSPDDIIPFGHDKAKISYDLIVATAPCVNLFRQCADLFTEFADDEGVNVLVIGAGISGISAGYHLQKYCPQKTYAVLEGRDAIGGTWDLFQYPGIRSDSDMYTFGFAFKPWTNPKAIADGPSIIKYLNEINQVFLW